ncbi:GNAT family N-acetyltransferase [Aliiroseovarius sp. S1339]|uniref:GNAT family N-acetyltransferase n=1 Tax=Aliiroseovarius sp. S1339 TaxID=2936990 RepID=UPI0020C162CF|nr:GNAT family N-acetyltransferase [Aliiroseovarius sp. S1339]MCK8463321.1 GNAT family N-acetyltransferase [Aliiroseovarius sp. S1339]
MITTRQARAEDAEGMSAVITPILISWRSARPRSPEHMRANYIQNPDNIRCSIAEDDAGRIVGFQSLILPKAHNPYGTPQGWGEIGTYVALDAGRGGIGRLLFADSLAAARDAGIKKIEASIGRDNPLGIAYYEAMGFKTHELTNTLDRKCYMISP